MIFKWGKKQSDQPDKGDQSGNAKPDAAQDKPDGFVENAVALATGLEMVDAFYPGHDPIDYYGQGGFRFGSYSHQGSLMFLPSGTRRWDIASPKEMTKEAFEHVFKEAEEIEILLIGSGTHLVPVNPELKAMFREHGIMADVMDTGAAVRTLNILLAEERAVAAAMLAVD